MIGHAKAIAKRHWPSLSLRTILFGTLLFVAALPGVAALFLRVYENTLVQQTEAELIAQGAVLSSAYRLAWGVAPGEDRDPRRRPAPEPPGIDLRTDAVLPATPAATPAPAPDARAVAIGQRLAPIVIDASAVTLSSTRLLDRHGIVVAGRDDLGMSYAALPEVRQALGGHSATVLRRRSDTPYGLHAPIEMISRAAAIRVHHVRPVIVGGRVVGVVMLSRSPRGLFLGLYQDRGKILLGIALIFLTLIGLAGLLSRGIARPIRALALASEQVGRGRLDIPDPPVTAAIEIRELYANFGVMARQIDRRARYLRDFAAAVSHEFKTPLAGIRGALELLDDHGADMDEADRRRFLDNAAADANRLARLVQRLLDLARADMASLDIDARCDGMAVARELAAQLRDGAMAIDVAPFGGSAVAHISRDTLATVLTTLIDNSRQAGAACVTIGFAARDERLLILVSDDGRGIADADLPRIFEAFFTGNRAQGSTGLGLPIARSLLAATDATIESVAAHKGAAFVIGIPRGQTA